MALITHRTQGPYQTAFLRPKSCNQGTSLRSFVAFQLVDRTAAFIPWKHRFYSKSHSINSSRGKHSQILSFKSSAHNIEPDHSDSSSKFAKPPVKLSYIREEREVITKSPDVQNHPISYVTEHKEDVTTGSHAIEKLFRKWLLMLQTQTSGHEDDVLGTKMAESETSESQKVTLRGEAGQLLKSMVVAFLKLDAAVSLPLLILSWRCRSGGVCLCRGDRCGGFSRALRCLPFIYFCFQFLCYVRMRGTFLM